MVHTWGDVLFDPVLLVENAEMRVSTVLVSYLRTFGVLGRSARVDVSVPVQTARWEGLVDGVFTTVRRDGFGDPRARLSVSLIGAPALRGREFGEYRAAHRTNTIVGAGLAVRVPLGEYHEDKLLNLGANRFVIRPQLGAVHTRGPWAFELTGSVFIFTVNDEFWNGNKREQDGLWALQYHIVRTFPHRLWASLSGARGWGGKSQVNDVPKDDLKGNVLFSAAFGFPVAGTSSGKMVYWRAETQTHVGTDTHNVALAYSILF